VKATKPSQVTGNKISLKHKYVPISTIKRALNDSQLKDGITQDNLPKDGKLKDIISKESLSKPNEPHSDSLR